MDAPLQHLACSTEGERVLASLGGGLLRRVGDSASAAGCGLWSGPSAAELDAGVDSVQQALSEAIVLVLAASPTTPTGGRSDALQMVRAYLSGPANVAAAFGLEDARVAAVTDVLIAAIGTADANLRLAAGRQPGAVATVVLSAPAPPLLEHAGRVLQGNDQNLCIDYKNCSVPPTIAVYSAASIGNYHIILWTAVLLAAILLLTLCALLGADGVKDPQLYTQLQDAAGSAGAAASAGAARTR